MTTLSENKLIERQMWLEEFGRKEKDILFDEDRGEFIYFDLEGEVGELGYITTRKLFLPVDLQK